MDAAEPKRRTARKKLPNIPYPEEVVCQYARFSHLLSHEATRKWLSYEWQYNEIDYGFFHKCRTFEMFLATKFPRLKTRNLSQAEWRAVRRLIVQRKCRRFSSKFIHEQRTELERYRYSYRLLQENNRHNQLVKLNGFHDAVDEFLSTLDSPDTQYFQLFRLCVEVKKLYAAKGGLISKLREINNLRLEIQQQQQQHLHQHQQLQHAIVNGDWNSVPPPTMTSATAIKVIAKIRDCNNDIASKLNQMMSFRIVKDAMLINAIKRQNVAVTCSPTYFKHISAVQVHESQQFYRSQTFITTMDVQEMLDICLAQSFFAIIVELTLKMNKPVEQFANDVVKDQMSVMTTALPDDCISYFENFCLPKFFEILDNLSKLLR